MNEKSFKVFTGFTKLSEAERKEVLKEIEDWAAKSGNQRIIREGEIRKSVFMGPTGGGCPCCGR